MTVLDHLDPGSSEAIARGCTCSPERNNQGRGVKTPGGMTAYVIADDCPLHGGEAIGDRSGTRKSGSGLTGTPKRKMNGGGRACSGKKEPPGVDFPAARRKRGFRVPRHCSDITEFCMLNSQWPISPSSRASRYATLARETARCLHLPHGIHWKHAPLSDETGARRILSGCNPSSR